MKPKPCAICERALDTFGRMCKSCCLSFDRTVGRNLSYVNAATWAAKRARKFAKARFDRECLNGESLDP